MLELLKRMRKLLQPMVGRGGVADKVERDIVASGIVPLLLSFEPKQLVARATEFLDREDELLSFLIQLTRIYGNAKNMRGLAFSAYNLARIHQRTWPVETARVYTPLLQLVVGILEARPDLPDDENELLLYAYEHLGYACEDRRDFAGAATALWKGSHLAAQRNDIRGALHLCGYLLGSHFAAVLSINGLPDRDAVIERLEGLLPRVSSPEHTIPAVLAIASIHINEGDVTRGRKMIDEMLAQCPDGPADEEYLPYWEQARALIALLDARASEPQSDPDLRGLVAASALVREDRFVDAWEVLRDLSIPRDVGAAVSYHFLRAYCLLQFTRFLESLAEIERALYMFDQLDSATGSDASAITLHYRLTGRESLRGEIVALCGEVLHRLRRFEEAATTYRQAIRLMSETGYKGVIWVQHNLGNLLREYGDFAGAEAAYEECIRKAGLACEARVEVRATGNLGLLRLDQGRFVEGIAKLNEAVALAKRHGDPWAAAHFQTNLMKRLLGSLVAEDRSAGGFDLGSAAELLATALTDIETHGNELMRLTATALQAQLAALDGRRADAAEAFNGFWASLQAQIDDIPGAQDVANVLRSHHSSLLAMAQFLFEEDDVETASRVCELARDGGLLLLRREGASTPGPRVPPALRDALERASNALALASADLHFGRIPEGSAAPLHRVRQEYREVCDQIAEIDSEWVGANLYLAPGTAPENVDLLIELCETDAGLHMLFRSRDADSCAFLPARKLHAISVMIRELYPARGVPHPPPALVDRLLRAAGELLVPIWKDHLPPREGRVMFVPSGKWVGVPFHAVEDPETQAPLDDAYFVGTSPSLGAMQRAYATAVDRRGGLVVGDPDSTLEGARLEAEILGQRYGDVFDDPLVGSAATGERVLQRVATSGWLHFSCHGRFNAAMPSQSVLRLADGDLSASRLLHAGRGYAGVVLSACEVGRSAADGLDPFGMSGIFLAAGARCVLAPLWNIEDEASMLFMESLYHYLNSAPMGIAATLARRDLRSLARFHASFYWAVFQVSGAPFHTAATPFRP